MSDQEIPPPPIYIYSIITPQTAPLQFEKTFKNLDDQTAITFKKISDARNEVVIASERAFADAAVRGVQKYLPALFGLMEAAEKLPPDFSKGLQIQWTSALGIHWLNTKFSHSNWYFEVVFVLTTYGLLYRKLAKERLSTTTEVEFDAHCKDIVKSLCTAAGVFHHIAEQVVPKFFVDPKDVPLPEVFTETFTLLTNISLAEAQALVVKRAIRKQNAPNVIAKLCAAIVNLYSHSINHLNSVIKQAPKNRKKFIVDSLSKYLTLSKMLWESEMNLFLARHNITEGKPGLAVAYVRKAESLLNDSLLNAKDTDPEMQYFIDKIKQRKSFVLDLRARYEADNQQIYHELVREDEVSNVEGKLLVKLIPFETPPPQEIQIVRKENTLCSVM